MLRTRTGFSGFSLTELMVTVAIVAILMSLAAPSFSTWIQNSRIRTTAESIQNGLQLARVEALKRNAAVEFVLTSLAAAGTDADWVVRCVVAADDSDGDGVADCPGVSVSPAPAVSPDAISQRPSAEGSRGIAVAAGASTFIFSGTGRVTPAPVVVIAIDISNPSGGNCVAASGPMRCLRVTVSPGGQVRMCDPSIPLSSPDPRRC